MMKVDKSAKTWMWVIGGIAAVALSAYAARRIQVWLAWTEERELEENDRKIEQYEDYVHANGHKRRRWWWGRAQVRS